MATITQNIRISKARVMDEVKKATAYIGSKAVSAQDPGAYERVATTDANREQLDRYWMEACSSAGILLDHWMVNQSSQMLSHHPEIGRANDYNVTLRMPTNWESQYAGILEEKIMSYLVNSIVSQWLLVAFPAQAATYAGLAGITERQISQLMLVRKRPAKRSPNTNSDGLWHRADIWVRSELW